MPNQVYYSDVKVMKKPLKQRVKLFFKFFMIVVVVIGCFFSAKHLSRALTVGNIGALIVYGDTKLKIPESIYYAVTLGEYADKIEAEQVALGASIQGASGFVWKSEKYYVIGNIYLNNDEALKVVENLKDSKYNTSIMTITLPKLNLNFEMYENSDMNIIRDAIQVFDKAYNVLYDYSIRFDKGEISHLAVSSGLSEVRGNIKSTIISVQNLINKNSSDLQKIQSALIKIDEVFDQSIIKTMDNSATNYSLKYSISSVVRIKYELFNELK